MISRTCLLFLPLIALAQEQAPPDVEQALRERVTGFYSNFLEGSFSPRKAEAFVAADTQDFFYDQGKKKFISFKVDKVTFTDNFTKAEVLVVGKRNVLIQGHPFVLDEPMPTRWKLENGKWCWTYDVCAIASTPMGGNICPDGKPPQGPPSPTGAVSAPKSFAPEDINKAGVDIVKSAKMGVDKPNVTMRADKPSTVQVVFTNGVAGEIQIGLDGPAVRGLKATLDKTTLPGYGKAVLTLEYDPTDKSGPTNVWEPKGRIPYRIVVSPFFKFFPISLMFTDSK
jgi:hypothetical protein